MTWLHSVYDICVSIRGCKGAREKSVVQMEQESQGRQNTLVNKEKENCSNGWGGTIYCL